MKRYLAAPLLVVLAMLAFGNQASAQSKWFVDDDNCPGPGTGTKADPFCTISEAVSAASGGDTIVVRAGEYNETVLVDKSLDIRGAQADTTATTGRTSAAHESTLDASSGAFDLQSDDITINGFTVEGSFDTSPTALEAGIRTSATHSGYKIVNNIVRDNIAGIFLNSDAANHNRVSNNRFHANNESGSGSGNAIESDQGLHDALISSNVFSGNSSSALLVSDSAPITNDGIEFVDNRADSPVLLYNTSGSSVSTNNFPDDMGSAVFLGGNDHSVTVHGNHMVQPVFAGVRVADNPSVANTDITISNNTIRGAGFYGIHVGASSMNGSTVLNNTVTGSDPEGLFVENGNSGNTFQGNAVTESRSFDIQDDSTGSGTQGTANTYIDNTCGTSDPAGLCA